MSKLRSMTTGLLVGLTLAVVAAPIVSAAPPVGVHSGRPLAAQLTGAQEVSGLGDPDGSGVAQLRLNQGQGTICYRLTVSNIAPATAAHIHVAPVGVAGPVVVPLTPPTSGTSEGCAIVDRVLIKAIRKGPANYYVNVHNAEFPGGAVRGQLSRWAPGQ
jgi:hypothetical protein